jgi:hypothetical protein
LKKERKAYYSSRVLLNGFNNMYTFHIKTADEAIPPWKTGGATILLGRKGLRVGADFSAIYKLSTVNI